MYRNTEKGIISTLLFMVVGIICVVYINTTPANKCTVNERDFVWVDGDYTYIISTGDELDRLNGSSIVLSSGCKPYIRNAINDTYVATKNGSSWNKREYSFGQKGYYEYFKIKTGNNTFTSEELVSLDNYIKELLPYLRKE